MSNPNIESQHPRSEFPVAVVDLENVNDGKYEVVQRFATPEEAVQFLSDYPDQEKVERGGFSIDAPEAAVVETMSNEVEHALRQGEVLLKGDTVSVELYVTVDDALTPQEAVEKFIRMIAHVGFDHFHFAVTDKEAGEQYYVKAGQLLNLSEVEAAATRPDDGD